VNEIRLDFRDISKRWVTSLTFQGRVTSLVT